MKYNTLIFDLDGTLLDTLEDLKDGANHALRTYGLPERSLEEVRAFVGNGIKNLIQKCVYEPLPDGKTGIYSVEQNEQIKLNSSVVSLDKAEFTQFDELLEEFRNFYNENSMNKTKAYDGIYELLNKLKQAGFRLLILSNKHDEAVKALSDHYFKNFIDAAAGSIEGIEKKPAADGVFRVLKTAGTDINGSIYIGDSEVDIKTAENAGIPCISCLWGFRKKEALIEAGANIFAEKPEDIWDIIGKLS
ncbi:MAG: HAD family hydrolase [Firmicutes bacterium]|nr:HAD family hydrolase [Bacillota bacterium]